MKKLLSIALAIVMMVAICVPAFAATIDQSMADQTGTVNVTTKYNEATDWSYIVTIPADISVDWGDTLEKDMTYSVESQLLIGASLDISAVADNGGLMSATGTTEQLKFNVTGGDAVHFTEVNAANTTAPGVIDGKNVKVAVESFAGKPVGTYQGTLTFTVVYNAPTSV